MKVCNANFLEIYRSFHNRKIGFERNKAERRILCAKIRNKKDEPYVVTLEFSRHYLRNVSPVTFFPYANTECPPYIVHFGGQILQ